MREHPCRTSLPVPPLWRAGLGAVVILSVLAVAAPAPAVAASPRGADLCAQIGDQAGFARDARLVTAVAVALAESGCGPTRQGFNGPTPGCPDGSVDRGLWQINDCYHAEVSDSCAYDAQCNATAAYQISSGGTDFTQWVTYNTGRYRSYLDQARAAVARLG